MTPQASTAQRARLLCVDDEQLVLSTLSRLFRADYDVVTAATGEEALRLLQQQHFQVIVSDQRMPGMKGVELLKQARTIAPQTMRILLTGYSDLSAIVDSVNEGEVFRYITKPWKNDVLRYTVALAAEAANSSAADVARLQESGLMVDVRVDEPDTGTSAGFTPPGFAPSGFATSGFATQGFGNSAAGALTTQLGQDQGPVDVLLLDPDLRFLELVRRSCDEGRHVYHATTVDQALSVLERNDGIGVIISEVRIGADDVTDLITTLKRYHPGIVTVVASGYSDANIVIRLINEGQIFRFVGKPVRVERMRHVIQRAGKMHLSLKRFSSLAARHEVDDAASVQSPITEPGVGRSPRELRERAAHTGQSSNTLIARIAGLFRRKAA